MVVRVSDHLQHFEDSVTVTGMHNHKAGFKKKLTIEGTYGFVVLFVFRLLFFVWEVGVTSYPDIVFEQKH